MALVTVGLPFFDEERHLEAAIRSILAQTITDLEILLVDDGSRDASRAIARSFRDPRVAVVSDGERRHLPARLNEIVARARAPFVARMDADDVMHPTRLARELALFDDNASLDVVGTWAALVDGDEAPFAVVETGTLPPSRRDALVRGVLPHASALGRRAWFAANPYDETLTRAEDRDLWCRTVTTTQFAVVPECLYVIRVDPTKASFVAGYLESQRQNRLIFRKYGPAVVGRLETARLLLASRARSVAMAAVARGGLADRLVRRRGRLPTARDVALVREALSAAAQRP
jgi:glycosyltransferase involved in cell wall biosynthesis